jgi:hypothetical protein
VDLGVGSKLSPVEDPDGGSNEEVVSKDLLSDFLEKTKTFEKKARKRQENQ